MLKRQARPANGNQAKHRYAGLLTCRECGNAFIPMIRCWNGKSRVEYVCRGYHRNGKTYCSSHRIHEAVLDAEVQEYAETVRKQCAEELKKLVQMQKMWALRKPILDARILSLQEKVQVLEQEIDEIVMTKIQPISSLEKYLKYKIVDQVDVALYKKLDNYVFQGRPLATILAKYKREVDVASDEDGKKLYGVLVNELRSIRKDREDLVEIVVKYLMETDQALVDALATYLSKKVSDN